MMATLVCFARGLCLQIISKPQQNCGHKVPQREQGTIRKEILAGTLKKRDPTLGKRNAGEFAKQPNSRRVLVFGLIHLQPSSCYRNSPFAWLLLQGTQGFILVTEP